MDRFWSDTIDRLTFAFQPILSCRDGRIIAVEALLRGVKEAGFPGIQEVFDLADRDGWLGEVESALRVKALKLFSLLPLAEEVKLFSNLDNRVLGLPGWRPSAVLGTLAGLGLSPDRLVLEISERHAFPKYLANLAGLTLALDDFGTGYSGLQTLFRVKPGFLKIDRSFVKGIEEDPDKQLFFEGIVDLGRRVGAFTIVEGVETRGELEYCLGTRCDGVQGFAVGRPALPGEPIGRFFPSQGLLFQPQTA